MRSVGDVILSRLLNTLCSTTSNHLRVPFIDSLVETDFIQNTMLSISLSQPLPSEDSHFPTPETLRPTNQLIVRRELISPAKLSSESELCFRHSWWWLAAEEKNCEIESRMACELRSTVGGWEEGQWAVPARLVCEGVDRSGAPALVNLSPHDLDEEELNHSIRPDPHELW